MNTKKITFKIRLLSTLLIFISILIIGYIDCSDKNQNQIENKMISNFYTTIEIEKEQVKENYIAIIEIPKINLKTGLVDPKSNNNTVEKHVQILNNSSMPDKENSSLFLAAHSGTSSISYFKNLYKLNVHDKVYIYYKNIKYTYQISDKYKEHKNGKITITSPKTTTLIMTTCDKEKDKQLVMISNLILKEPY